MSGVVIVSYPQRNHLAPGVVRKLLKVSFWTVKDLVDVKAMVMPIVQRNRSRQRNGEEFAGLKGDPTVTRRIDVRMRQCYIF